MQNKNSSFDGLLLPVSCLLINCFFICHPHCKSWLLHECLHQFSNLKFWWCFSIQELVIQQLVRRWAPHGVGLSALVHKIFQKRRYSGIAYEWRAPKYTKDTLTKAPDVDFTCVVTFHHFGRRVRGCPFLGGYLITFHPRVTEPTQFYYAFWAERNVVWLYTIMDEFLLVEVVERKHYVKTEPA